METVCKGGSDLIYSSRELGQGDGEAKGNGWAGVTGKGYSQTARAFGDLPARAHIHSHTSPVRTVVIFAKGGWEKGVLCGARLVRKRKGADDGRWAVAASGAN